MFLYGMATLLPTKQVKSEVPDGFQSWYANNLVFQGSGSKIAKDMEII